MPRGVKPKGMDHRFGAFTAEDPEMPPISHGSACAVCLNKAEGREHATSGQGSNVLRYRYARFFVAVSGMLACFSADAQAQGKLEARYTASLAGIPLGTGIWVIDIAPDQYTAVASGRTTGLVKLISDGSGSGGSRGIVQGASIVPTSYASSTTTDKHSDEVRMTLRAGIVKDVLAEPPLVPSPDRVPVTEAHRKGVTDPMSAMIIPVPGNGEVLAPEACKRKLAIFDGRQRADIELVFKRMDRVK